MLFKIFCNPKHPLYYGLPGFSFYSLAFSVVRFNAAQFSRSFNPAVTRLWNDFSNYVVESVQLKNIQ